jgi:RNA polymerase sigma-70 factor (ECF subfamily)
MKDDAGGNLNRARFQAICQSLRPDLVRFAFWLSRDQALAEDVVQETMLRAWKARDSLKDETAAKPWFLTIVRREYARSFERKRLVTVDVDELIAKEEPMLAASQDQELAELRAALFKLPEEYREPLVLQVLMGYSTAEIAAELNHPAVQGPQAAACIVRRRHELGSGMINCAEYRRAVLADPRDADAELARHRESCAECSAYTERLLRFEGKLARAMRVSPRDAVAPGGAAFGGAGPADAVVIPLRPRRQRVPRRWLAMAASVLLGLGIAGGLWLAAIPASRPRWWRTWRASRKPGRVPTCRFPRPSSISCCAIPICACVPTPAS